MTRSYYVYVLASVSRTLYTGVTNNLDRRMHEHKQGLIPGFTSRYHVDRLVYYEETSDIGAAIAREKQIKGWLRAKKVALAESVNPRWEDLSARWLDGGEMAERVAESSHEAENGIVAE